jgi:hypothetical protein
MKTTRTTAAFAAFSSLAALSVASPAFAYEDASETHLVGPASDAAEADAEAEEETSDEAEYCGGDEASPLDEADQLLGDQEWMGLYREAGRLLREGRADWQRAQALSYLATAQLHLGRARPAARNFGLAFAVDAEQVAPGLRVEHAIALFRSGQRDEAHATARVFAEQECVAPAAWLVTSCWAARTVMAETTDDGTEGAAQRQMAAAILPQDEARLGQVADFRALLGEGALEPRVAAR